MKDRTKNICGILALIAAAAALIIYSSDIRGTQHAVQGAEVEAPEIEVITSDPNSATPSEEVKTDSPDITTDAVPVIDTSPHEHPLIGVVPQKPGAVELAVYNQARDKMQSAIDTLSKNSRNYEAWLELAIYEFSVFKNEKRAEEIWKFIEKDRPGMLQPVVNLAQLYFRRDDFVLAEGYLRKAIANEPRYLQAYSDLYAIYKTQGKSESAIDVLKQGIAADSSEHYLNYVLAGYYLELGKKSEALAQYQEALARAKKTSNTDVIKAIQEDINRLK
jgi:tetratricopeptide (TPR) repeat protein